MPDVQRRRPEVSSALAAVVERASEKKPDKRYPDMAAMLADLENALEVEVARAGRSTGEATNVLDSVPNRRRRILTSRRVSVAGILLVLAGTAAALLIAGITGSDRPRGGGAALGNGTEPVGEEIELQAANDFDPPPGDNVEHTDDVELAIDSNLDTIWSTETYTAAAEVLAAANKPGVGLILDAGEPVEGSGLSVSSSEGGWNAAVYATADDPPDTLEEWGDPVGTESDAEADQLIELDVPEPAQYYLLWFTKLAEYDGFRVEIEEVGLSAA